MANSKFHPDKSWGVDRAGSRGCRAYDGKHYQHFPTMVDVAIAAADAGIETVGIERTDIPFGMKKSEIHAEFKSRGVRLVQIHPKRTAYYRKNKKLLKSDKNDAFAIYWMMLGKTEFSDPREVSNEWSDHSSKVNGVANATRYGLGGGNTMAKRVILKIVGKRNVPKEVLTQSGALSAQGLAVAWGTINTENRDDCERMVGAYGNGHSCYLRADYMRGLATARKNRGISFTDSRRGLRRFASLVVKHKEEILKALPHLKVRKSGR